MSNHINSADVVRARPVTRGSPPQEHQFRKGTSGNPRGRPPGTKDFKTLIQRELDRVFKATLDGRTVKITKREAMAMRLVDKALSGDHRAIEACIKFGAVPKTVAEDLIESRYII